MQVDAWTKPLTFQKTLQQGSVIGSLPWHGYLAGRPGRYEFSVSVSSTISTSSWHLDFGDQNEAETYDMSIGSRCGFVEDRVMDRNGWRVKRGAGSRGGLEFDSISQSGTSQFDAKSCRRTELRRGYA